MNSLELFSGAGGLALGIAQAGFNHLAVVERDRAACTTLRTNQNAGLAPEMASWPIFEMDVQQLDYSSFPTDVELVAGGVPCQPFSIGGKHRAHEDDRNMFPELVNAVRRLGPKSVLVENVRGLARKSFARYFGYIQLMLMYPELGKRVNEEWSDHLSRLERYHTAGKRDGLYYRVVHRVLNAADFGVPQRRERLFMVAIRSDVSIEWSFPPHTHSYDALLWSKFQTGEYWERHRIAKRRREIPNPRMKARVEKMRDSLSLSSTEPWRTVRDAISDLPLPGKERAPNEPYLNHFFVPGARVYTGHTGSLLDDPAKTLKAGVHGVPGGENMVVCDDGSVRYFTVRESARLQTFPDNYIFPGPWTESMRQIGNAVPVHLATVIADKISSELRRADRSRKIRSAQA